MTEREMIERAARRHAETARLLGVDFLPKRAGSVAASEVEAKPGGAGGGAGDDPGGGKRAALDELRARYGRQSEVARSISGWTNVVFGDGDPDARLMFVGEAPGADEDREGVPFVGRAGKKLNEMIRAMGLSRESVYIANVLKVRPPNNRTPTAEESKSDGVFLDEQIGIIDPEVIVTLGLPASHYLLETTQSMGRLRGRWHEYRGIAVMPTYHPAYLLRSYTEENRRKVWSDLCMVMERLGLGRG